MSIVGREWPRLWSLLKIMEKFEPGWLIRISHELTRFAPSDAVPEPFRETYRTNTLPVALGELAVQCGRLGLRVSRTQAHDLHFLLGRNPAYDIMPRLTTLIETIETEMRSQCFLELSVDKIDFFRQVKPLFGTDFATKFQSVAYDLDEAGKCLAFERTTAAVFHLMRLMEIGLRATARSLSIPDPVKAAQRNWGGILKRLKAEMDRRNNASPKAWATANDEHFFAEVYASLDAVRNVWRNATMHLEKTYTEEEAEHIFGAVRGFMRKLASRLDEQGQPLA